MIQYNIGLIKVRITNIIRIKKNIKPFKEYLKTKSEVLLRFSSGHNIPLNTFFRKT